MDLLRKLYYRDITEDEAHDIFEELVDSPNTPDLAAASGMSKVEYTAYIQGASFPAVATWRYEGWPEICPLCGQPLIIANFGWIVREHEPNSFTIEHIECPVKQSK